MRTIKLWQPISLQISSPQDAVETIEIKQPADAPDSRYGNLIDTSYGLSGVSSFEFQLKRFLFPSQFTPCTYFEGSFADSWSEVLVLATRAAARPYEFGQGPKLCRSNQTLSALGQLWSASRCRLPVWSPICSSVLLTRPAWFTHFGRPHGGQVEPLLKQPTSQILKTPVLAHLTRALTSLNSDQTNLWCFFNLSIRMGKGAFPAR